MDKLIKIFEVDLKALRSGYVYFIVFNGKDIAKMNYVGDKKITLTRLKTGELHKRKTLKEINFWLENLQMKKEGTYGLRIIKGVKENEKGRDDW